MKKLLIVALMLVSVFSLQAQIKGIDFSTAITPNSSASINDYEGILTTYDDYYIIIYVLSDNNLKFKNPDKDLTYLPDWIDGYTDYSSIKLACSTKNGRISKIWYLPNSWGIFWVINENIAAIMMSKK